MLFRSILSSAVIFLCLASTSIVSAEVDRPPQYVLIAFDGSSSIPMWKKTREFAIHSKQQNAPVKFTYFVSGVYYVGKDFKKKYQAPNRGPGASAIGWGADFSDLQARYDQTNLAHNEKNEIASHGNGHFDGSTWTLQNWRDEFRQFHEIIFNFFEVNSGLVPTPLFPNGWAFGRKSMVGFRAPQLGTSSGLWDTLREFGYRYDTSKTSKSNYWPQRDSNSGVWNFPLAALVIAGTGKRTLSMDYNFYVADSNAQPNSTAKQRYRSQMLETYLQYFDRNYNGNRAPVHIGHHFSLWNGGAYWEALQEFTLRVCGLPEVQCITYAELADVLDTKTRAQLAGYQTGDFPKLVSMSLAEGVRTLDLEMKIVSRPPQITVQRDGRDKYLQEQDRLEARVNGEPLAVSGIDGTLDSETLRRKYFGQNVTIEVRLLRRGYEIARATHQMSEVGRATEKISKEPAEARALRGDLPEAHADGSGPTEAPHKNEEPIHNRH